MNINKVNNAVRVFDIVKRFDDRQPIIKIDNKINDRELLKNDSDRVYFIVVDGEIMKIGGSGCEGGILATFGFYCGAMGGGPSDRTFGIMYLIRKALDRGSKVEIFMIISEKIEMEIPSLNGMSKVLVSPNFRVFEGICNNEYKEINGEYPTWNYQERGEQWPEEIIYYKANRSEFRSVVENIEINNLNK